MPSSTNERQFTERWYPGRYHCGCGGWRPDSSLVAVGVLLTKKILAAPKATSTKIQLKDSVVIATSNAVDMTAVSAIPTTVEAVGS